MKVVSINQCQIILTSFQNFNGALDKVLMHYCRMSMIEKWKRSTDKGRNFAALLTDLSKAFGFPPHDLVNAKPNLLKRQPHKMVKHTQAIHRQQRTNCSSMLDHFVGLALNPVQGGPFRALPV